MRALSGDGSTFSGRLIFQSGFGERQHGEPPLRAGRSDIRWKREEREWLPLITPTRARHGAWLCEVETNPYDAARCVCHHGADQMWKRRREQQSELAASGGTDDRNTTALGDHIVPIEQPTQTSLDALQRDLHHR